MTQIGSNVALGSNVQLGANDQFSPLWFEGCVAWFDMQDPRSYVVASGAVSDIVNKASGVTWTQGTAANRPLFDATKLNGFPCLDCDGSNDYIMSTEAAVVAACTNSPAITVMAVFLCDTPDSSTSFFAAANSTEITKSSRGWGTNTTGSGNWLANAANDAGTQVTVQSVGSTANTNPNVFEYWSTGAVSSIRINGGTADPNGAAQAIGTLTPNRCAIGGAPRSNPNAFFDGAVGEVLVFNRELSELERAIIRTYLLRKWGIADPSPLTILGSAAWWVRFDQGVSLNSGNVSQVNDLSGNGVNFTQGTAINQPLFVSSAINNRPAARGDGSNDVLLATWSRSAPGTQPFYIWLICKQITWTVNKIICGDFNGTSGFMNRQRGPSGIPAIQQFNTTHVNENMGGVLGNWYRHEAYYSNSVSDYLKIGSTNATGANAGNTAGTGTMGLLGGAAGTGANVEIAEAFAFLGTPSATQRAWLDAYAYLLYGPTLGL